MTDGPAELPARNVAPISPRITSLRSVPGGAGRSRADQV
jgi:hypothetical protein